MKTRKVWTKQHRHVLEELHESGRYTAKRRYIEQDLQEHSKIMLEAYDWLVKNGPHAKDRPADVQYPVWVSLTKDATMLPDDNTVILELELNPSDITYINIEKWGMILNYSYIPSDETDGKRHRDLLKAYHISDAKAYMSQFYPQIKAEITASWSRLFDDTVPVHNPSCYGTIWEVRTEWITKIIQ